MDNQEIDKALREIFELLSETNAYVDQQAPWVLLKSNIARMNVVLSLAIELIKRSALMLYPVIPGSCLKVFACYTCHERCSIFVLTSLRFGINKLIKIEPKIYKITVSNSKRMSESIFDRF